MPKNYPDDYPPKPDDETDEPEPSEAGWNWDINWGDM